MSSLKLFLLGPPRLERDGVPLEFDTRKNVALVAYLAMTASSRGQGCSRETLVTWLWPELEPDRARGVLRRNLSVLKKALGDEWMIVEREIVSTDPEADFWLDVARFRDLSLAWQKHGHPEGEACPECMVALAEAVELYGGDFMAGFSLPDSVAFDEWQLFQTEGLRQKLASVLERLVRGYSDRGEFERAISYARRWASLDPLHEPAQRWLMVLYAQTGQRAAALRQYQTCARILEAEVGLSPSAETLSLHEQIRAGQIGRAESLVPVPQRRHNLPVQPTPFIGRQALLAQIRARLRNPDCRLLTLVGPGGSGKTRLALEAAAALLGGFEHGVFFVSLAPLQAAEATLPTVAQAIGFSFYAAVEGSLEIEPRQQLLDYLRQKRMLLILDNFEHLLPPACEGDEAAISLVTDTLRTAPAVRILVTSRARLNVQGEHLFPVTGMSFPVLTPAPSSKGGKGELGNAARYSAVRLFVASARRVQQGFELTTDNSAAVVHICHLVDGMPLGIVLAAAWVQMLSPAEIAAQIEQSIDFLEADLRDVPERHRSMRAVFDRSWSLLTEREREVFQGISVFRGGFTWEAAQRITGASLRELMELVNKSLLRRTSTGQYEAHELLRQYAAGKLDESPAAGEVTRDRHCAYYTSALQRLATGLKGPQQQEALAEMDVEVENARGAWEWAVGRGQVERLDQAMDSLCLFYTRRSRHEEGEALCRAAAESLQTTRCDDGPRVRAKALRWQSAFEQELGHIELASHLLRQSLDLIKELELSDQDTRAERASVLLRMGEIAYNSGRREAWRLFEQSLALYRALGDRWRTAYVLRALGSVALNLGDYSRAKQSYEESLAIRRALGDQWGIANSLQGLGRVALSLGEIEGGERLAREGIAISEEIGDQVGIVKGLNNLSLLLSWSGRFAEAQALLERSAAICNHLGFRVGLVYAHAFLSTMKGHLGEYELSCSLAYKCLNLAREISHSWALGYALILLGGIALVENKYDEAWQLLQDSLSVYREAGQQETTGFSLVFSGVVALRSGQLSLARQYLCEALRMLSAIGAFEPSVAAVAAMALFLAGQGQRERAVELYGLASRYPLVSRSCLFNDIFGRHIAAVAATLPPDVVTAAQERGRTRDLETTTAELLAESEA